MSYNLLKTDGSTLTQVVDGTIDQSHTDLTLIGKDASNYGSYINENFIYLLENFAGVAEPSKGQRSGAFRHPAFASTVDGEYAKGEEDLSG